MYLAPRRLVALLAPLTFVAAALLPAGTAGAATINVACNPTTLANAITTANGTAAADTLELASGCQYSMSTPAVVAGGNDTALPTITQPLTINGNAATLTRVTNGTNPANMRIVGIANAGAVQLTNLLISSGRLTTPNAHGGGILSTGSQLTLTRVTLTGNSTTSGTGAAASSGGGLHVAGGSALLDHVNIQGNAAAIAGGASFLDATTTIRRSSLIVNGALQTAGAVLIRGGTASIDATTVAFNNAANGVGGIAVADNGVASPASVAITESTLTDNAIIGGTNQPAGTSVFAATTVAGASASVQLSDSIINDDSTAAPVAPACATSGGTIDVTGATYEFPTTACAGSIRVNPRLGAIGLAINTYSYPLLADSPAIDAAGLGCAGTFDQNDIARPSGEACDSGAREAIFPQTIATANAAITNSPSITLTADRPGATFECQVDGGGFAACATPFEPTLTAGTHTIAVRAILAGFVDRSPAAVVVTVDRTAPVVQAGGVPALTNDATPTVAFTVNEAATATCQVDATAFVACTSPFTTAALADGPHTVRVRAVDTAGNSSDALVSFEVDTTAPIVSITSAPTSTGDRQPTIEFTVDDATATVRCAVDGGAPVPCTSPYTLPLLTPDGDHTVVVRATDAATNAGSDQATINVDLGTPLVEFSHVDAVTTDTTPTITFSVNEANTTITCKVDAGAAVPCTSPFTVATPLANGSHTVLVTAVDAAGNAGTASTTFEVDTLAPVVTITSAPTPTTDTTPTIAFTVSDEFATVTCKVDAAAAAPCTSPFTVATPLAAGTHTIVVRAVDTVGNVGTRTATFVVANAAPTVALAPVATPTRDQDPTIQFTTTNATAVTCKVDTATAKACTSPFTTPKLAAGTHKVVVTATGPGGSTSQTATFVIDITAPNTTISAGPSGATPDATSTFTFTADQAGSTFACRLDAGLWEACQSPKLVTGYAMGAHTFSVRATDAAGNVDASPATRSFTFGAVTDTKAPLIWFLVAPAAKTTLKNAPFLFLVNEPTRSVTCQVDSKAPVPCYLAFVTPTLALGAHTVKIVATDAAGNAGTATWNFTVVK